MDPNIAKMMGFAGFGAKRKANANPELSYEIVQSASTPTATNDPLEDMLKRKQKKEEDKRRRAAAKEKKPRAGPAKPAGLPGPAKPGPARPSGPAKPGPARPPGPAGPARGTKRSAEALIEKGETGKPMVGPPIPKTFVGPPIPQNYEESMKKLEIKEKLDPVSQYGLPATRQITLKAHTATISAMDLDPSGARLVTGSLDYTVKMWDFGGMTSSHKHFRSFEADENYPITSVGWSPSGDMFIVGTGSVHPRLYDRHGAELAFGLMGDMYIRDLKHTRGHVSGIVHAQFHPLDKEIGMTAGQDGTLRFWDLSEVAGDNLKQRSVIKTKSLDSRSRTMVTTARYHPDGSLVAAATTEGTIQLFDPSRKGGVPSHFFKTAHEKGSTTSCLSFSRDGLVLVSRGGDDTMKVWDLRYIKAPVAEMEGLPNAFGMCDAIFSPDQKFLVTGTCQGETETDGVLIFYDFVNLKEITTMTYPKGVSRLGWNQTINQIMVGCHDGRTRVLYDEHVSQKGAKLSIIRGAKKKDIADGVYGLRPDIHLPHALDQFKRSSRHKQREINRKDPIRSKEPERPALVSAGGRIAQTAKNSVMTSVEVLTYKEDDPRKALLEYAELAEKDPIFVDVAYKKTQPKKIFDEEDYSDVFEPPAKRPR